MTELDKAFFKYVANELRGARPEQIIEYYVKNFIFKNEGYLQYLQKTYKLPDDFLKLHAKVVKLAGGMIGDQS